MRFLLYNICYGTHRNQRRFPLLGMLGRTRDHLDEIIRFLDSEDPDVIGLVEVDAGSYRSGRVSQVEKISSALGHYHTYCSKYGVHSKWQHVPIYNQQGNAFLAKDTIQEARYHYFELGMKKLVIELELEKVTFFLVHLALTYRKRTEQIIHLYEMIRKTNRPYIVAGDFNAFTGDQEIRLLMAASQLENANVLNLPSYPSHQPKRHLDFILHSPSIRVHDFRMPDCRLSDHLPLVLDFEVIEESAD
ncbi:MAG: endonuclease [Kiritimatiellaceae bacterium]|nr:endonuclease [Kiritimatiellaceae bacterium]RZO88023.1 MAG: endonuclease [Kiritimatiellaceae bacterium]|tara:strand:+ start:377 stop:1117 length:741 start_codon:yes stop_codon:yes gene_type:complete